MCVCVCVYVCVCVTVCLCECVCVTVCLWVWCVPGCGVGVGVCVCGVVSVSVCFVSLHPSFLVALFVTSAVLKASIIEPCSGTTRMGWPAKPPNPPALSF